MIELRKITDDNMRECISLQVNDSQKDFVATNLNSLADAYVCITNGGQVNAYAIYAEEVMVGFVMYEFVKHEIDNTFDEDCYYFWRFMVDKNHQGKGYGRQVMAKIVDEVKKKPFGTANYLYTSYMPKNTVAQKLYKSFGFTETGQLIDDELVARLKI